MKINIAFLLSFLIYGCNEDRKQDSIANFKNNHIFQSYTDNNAILGQWSLCAESGRGQMIQYNTCSIVVFNIDGSGSKISPGGQIETFSWLLKKGVLRITYAARSNSNCFSDSIYCARFLSDKSGTDLEIRQEQKGYSYYLGKAR